MTRILNIRLFFLLCVAGTFLVFVMHLLADVGSSRIHADATALILQVDTVRTLIVNQSEKPSGTRGSTLSSRFKLVNGTATAQRFNVTRENDNTTTTRGDSDTKDGNSASTKQQNKEYGNNASKKEHDNKEENFAARNEHENKDGDAAAKKGHDNKDGNAASTKEHDAKEGNAAATKEQHGNAEKKQQKDAPTNPSIAREKLPKILTNEQKFVTKVENHIKGLSEGSVKTFLQTAIQRAISRKKGWQSLRNQTALDSQFIQYLKCPTSVRMKLMSGQTVRHFVAETPILAWNKHFSKAEYQRLSQFYSSSGWQHMKESNIASSLAALNSSHSRYLFDDLMVNGSTPNDKKCIRCAVVGNGGILNGSMMGNEIDANDYVFRVNTALTKGHEKDVGTRTSFYCFSITTYYNTISTRFVTRFYNAPSDEGIRYVFFPDSEWSYSYISAALNKRRLPKVSSGKGWWMAPPHFPKELTAKNIKLVHPDFIRYIKLSWVNSRHKHKAIHRPTTGGIMLLLALHTCDEVNVYGFGGSTVRFSDHYYDKDFYRRVQYSNHDNDAEDKLWHLLHERGIINLYTRD